MTEQSKRLYSVKLTADELRKLDAECSPEVQGVVNDMLAERRIVFTYGVSDKIAAMVVKIIHVAEAKGKLTCAPTQIHDCPACGAGGDYNVHRHNKYSRGKFRSCIGRAGEKDYDSPILITGYDVDRGLVTMKQTIWTGYCGQCAPAIEPVLKEELACMKYDHPEGWLGMHNVFTAHPKRKCLSCGFIGGENQWKPLPAIMNGFYPGQCPQCGVKHLPLDPVAVWEHLEGSVLTETKERVK